MNRLIKRKNLFALLFAVLLALPMCAILGRVLYTQWNKNAKDSYSDVLTSRTTQVENNSSMINGYTYLITDYINASTGNSNFYGFTSISIDLNYYFSGYQNINNIGVWVHTNGAAYLITSQNGSTIYSQSLRYTDLPDITFVSDGTTINSWGVTPNPNYKLYTLYMVKNTLDNAFEYSVNQFINDNNFGKLDFFQWFDNMFLDSNNSVNNMYLHFVNWYLNYALLISLAYILFLVLMWFINYVRKLLERGMDFGEGSY